MKSIWKHNAYKSEAKGEYSTLVTNDGVKYRAFILIVRKKVIYKGSVSEAKSRGWYKVK